MSNAPSTSLDSASPAGSMALLQLVAQDRHLMSELEKDPKAVLETHGLFLNSQEIPSAISLPSVEAIQEAYLAVDESLNFHGFFGGGGD